MHYTHVMDDVKTPRDRRSRRAEATRLRIIEAAAKLEEAREWLTERASAFAAVMRRPGNGHADEKEAR